MIDEHELRSLLTEAAEAVPPPGRAPQALLDVIAEQQAPKRRAAAGSRSRRWPVAVAAVLLLAVAGAALAGVQLESTRSFDETGAAIGGDEASDGGSAVREDAGDGSQLVETGGGGGEPAPLAPSAARPGAAPAPAVGGSTGAGTGSVGAPVGDSAKVIRTGSLDLEVREGAFQSTVDRITAQVVGLGGYVADASTSESGDSPSGSITVRVPGDSFDQLMSDLRKLGDVKAVTSKGTDVTAQFTDLAARLRALTATRDRLQAVLAEADNVPDILAVQDRITTVQVEIEKVQGEQKRLEDQTDFGTIAITLGEPGAEIIEVDPPGDGGLGQAWEDARRRFGDNVETIVSWSGSAAVALVVLLVGLGVGRLAWVGLRRRAV